MSKSTLYLCLVVSAVFFTQGCTKLLNKQPVTELTGDQLFTSDQSALSVVLGISNKTMEAAGYYNSQATRYLGLYTDELIRVQAGNQADSLFYNNLVTPAELTILQWWNAGFNYLYQTNAALYKLEHSTGMSVQVKQQLTGEVLFLRSLFLAGLTNLYGDIPLVLETNPSITRYLKKSPRDTIYRQIKDDLLKSYDLVDAAYPAMPGRPSARCRVNKNTVGALLSKMFLQMGSYAHAITWSTRVINDAQYTLEPDPDGVFLAQSRETIFALYPSNSSNNVIMESRLFLATKPLVALAPGLLQRFDAGDARLQKWTKKVQTTQGIVTVPYKYKAFVADKVNEYAVWLRLAEQYLIRAEAYWAQDNLLQAITDINTIRKRAGLFLLSASLDNSNVRAAIERENQREFFAENGHRFTDLKRWGTTGETLAITKPGKWEDHMLNLPIPGIEVQKSAVTQNAGYD